MIITEITVRVEQADADGVYKLCIAVDATKASNGKSRKYTLAQYAYHSSLRSHFDYMWDSLGFGVLRALEDIQATEENEGDGDGD